MKKALSVFFGIVGGYAVLGWLFLLISNIQGKIVPDGNPLDPWWLVWGLLLLSLAATAVAITIWPKEKCRIFVR